MKKPGLLLLSTLLSVSAHADVIGSAKDWKLEKVTNAETQVSTCTAVTALTANKITYRLEVIKEMKASSPLQVLVRSSLKPATITAFNGVLEDGSKKKYMLVALAGTQHNGHDFYQIPQNTEALLAYLKKGSRLRVASAHAKIPGTIDFSLKGSTAMLDALQKNCNSGLALSNSAFESVFLPAEIVKVDPTRIALEQASSARNAVFVGHEKYQAVIALDKQLNDLNNQNAPLVNERASLRKAVEQTIPSEQHALVERREVLNAGILNGQNRVKAIDVEVPRLQKAVPAAETELAAAKKDYEAVAPEHDRLDVEVDEAHGRVQAVQRDISNISSDINSTRNELASLRSESSSLNSRLSQLARDVETTRREYDNADSEVRRFDGDRELRERLSRDFSYQNALRRANDAGREAERVEREIRPLRDEADRLERQAREYERATQQARNRVKECQSSSPMAVEINRPRPPGEGPGQPRPGEPRPPGTPVPSDPLPPRRDCTRELAEFEQAQRQEQEADRAAQQAKSRYSEAERRLDSAEREARSARDEAERISSRIESEVRSVERNLQDRLDRASREYRNAQAAYDSARQRLADIDSLIPQKERSLSRLESELQTSRTDLANAQRRLEIAQQALSAYDSRVGYANKSSRYSTAIDRLDGLNEQIESLQTEKSKTLASIKRMEAELVTNAQRQSELAQELTAKQARLAEVQKLLAVYDQRKAELTNERVGAAQAFETAKLEFKTAVGL